MATDTTGSLILGLKDGMGKPLVQYPGLTFVNGNPSGVYTVQVGSDIAIDVANGSIYMGLSAGAEEWYALGSAAF